MKEYPYRPVIIVWRDILDDARKYLLDKMDLVAHGDG